MTLPPRTPASRPRPLAAGLASLALLLVTPVDASALVQHGGAGARGDGGSRLRPSRQVVRSADADGDGEVDAAEWAAFVGSLERSERGTVDAEAFRARLLVRLVDQDLDGRITLDDLFLVHEALDANVDYVLQEGELAAAVVVTGNTNARRRRDANEPASLFTASLPARLADVDGDGAVDEEEWGVFVDGLELDTDGGVASRELARWLAAGAESNEERGGFSPAFVFRWIDDGVDPDGDGELTTADVQAFFDELDDDADGRVDVEELRFSAGSFFGTSPEDEDREPLMPWQRGLADAQALVRTTGKPLLVCVNMDDEVASDSFAFSRYRDPEFVGWVEGFVPVLVSPDRHAALDHDDRGRRIVDERFGRVTSGEHVALEAQLGDRYLGDRRVAPRHLAVDASGEVLFDIYLVNDLTLVDRALREHGVHGTSLPDPAELDEARLLASPDAACRERLEQSFLEGDEEERARLASLALSATRATQHPELLRLALRDPAPAVRAAGAWGVARFVERAPLALVAPALRVARGDAPLEAALELAVAERAQRAAGDEATRLRRLHAALAGMRAEAPGVDVETWSVALAWSADAPPEPDEAPAPSAPRAEDAALELARLERAVSRAPEDPERHLAFAAAALRYADALRREGAEAELVLRDALAAAERADELAPRDGRAPALGALAAARLGVEGRATELATRAVPALLPWAGTRLAADALELFVAGRLVAARDALAGETPEAGAPEALADARAALEVLAAHPLGPLGRDALVARTVELVALLDDSGLQGAQRPLLRAALGRAAGDERLHAAWRAQLLRDEGADALVASYEELVAAARAAGRPRDAAHLAWFGARARVAAAERCVQTRRPDEAMDAYRAALAGLERAVEADPALAGATPPVEASALTGLASLHLDEGEWREALAALRRGVEAYPTGVWDRNGLGRSPRDVATRLHRALLDGAHTSEADALHDFLRRNGVRLDAAYPAGSGSG